MVFLKLGVVIYSMVVFLVIDLYVQTSVAVTEQHQFLISNHPYYYLGTNYWYGGLIGNDEKGKQRICNELDFLQQKEINNLRALAGAEGIGQINGVRRDNLSYLASSSTGLRNRCYATIFNSLLLSFQQRSVIAGCNFWTFSGTGRPYYSQLLWKRENDILGDTSVEEQGLNSVFDTDINIWNLIESFTEKINYNDKIEN